jgi:hypothetical protein
MVRFIPSEAGQKEVNVAVAELVEVPVLVFPMVNVVLVVTRENTVSLKDSLQTN